MKTLIAVAIGAAALTLTACGSGDTDAAPAVEAETETVSVDDQMRADLESLGLTGSVDQLVDRAPEVCDDLRAADADYGQGMVDIKWDMATSLNGVAIGLNGDLPDGGHEQAAQRVTEIQVAARCPEFS